MSGTQPRGGAPADAHIFFFNDTATTEIYTLSLHDALPISMPEPAGDQNQEAGGARGWKAMRAELDRKSTRLNSSHLGISYAVFCLKKKRRGLSAQTPPTTRGDAKLTERRWIADNASAHRDG